VTEGDGTVTVDAEGLSDDEAAARLVTFGRNTVGGSRRIPVVVDLLSRLKNPLLVLLLFAAAVSLATGDVGSACIVLAMVVMSAVLDFIQERNAGRAAEKLRRAAGVRATVVRRGHPREILAEDVVPGDVVVLSAGDLVPGDGVVLEARDLFVNQALLTGEPYPVEKSPNGAGDADAKRVFMGTSVVTGSAKARIETTGARTRVGELGATLQRTPPPTSFEVGTKQFGLLVVRLAAGMVLFVLLVNIIRERPLLESFLFAIALAVGLAPEMLPMVVSVTLARGAVRLSRKKVLTKRLAAIHDLGSMDTLCTDKTGTLTEAKIRLEKHLDAYGNETDEVLLLAVVNSAFESGIKSPLDEAILAHAEHIDLAKWKKIDEVPFDFERRRVSVLAVYDDGSARDGAGVHKLIVKGAFEDILRISTSVATEDASGARAIDDRMRRALVSRFEDLGRDGFRVLGVAYKDERKDCVHAVVDDETELVFAGFAAFRDPPKQSAAAAMRALADAGVAVAIVTGDHELVAAHVCKELGIEVRGVLTGHDLEAMDNDALAARTESTTLYCRVTPAQKNRIITMLKHRGHVVGFLGDGVNDATALHSADVGISVDSAVDVAKEAADLILLESDLGVLHDAVLEGRRTIGNIIKYIMMGTASNFGNMFSMAGASVFLPFLPMLPMQILTNNFLYDVSELPIPTDSVDDDYLARPHRWDMRFVQRFMWVMGPVSSLFDFATFALLLVLVHGDERIFHTGWFIESLVTQVLVIFVVRTKKSPFATQPSKPLIAMAIVVVVLAVVLPLSPLGAIIGFATPPPVFFAILVPLVVAYLVAAEAVKRFFYARVATARAANVLIDKPTRFERLSRQVGAS
jgi:Mg2+-importing ATPase